MNEEALKSRSFRVNDETVDKIKAIAATLGGNQQNAFSAMIEAYEGALAKDAYPEQSENIERFNDYLSTISRMYMDALLIGKDARELIRREYESEIEAKKDTIADLAGKIKDVETALAQEQEKNVPLKEENKNLVSKLENQQAEFETYKESSEKQISELKARMEQLQHEMKEVSSSEKETRIAYQTNVKELNEVRKNMERIRSSEATAKDMVSHLTNLKITHEAEIEKLSAKVDSLAFENESMKDTLNVQEKLIRDQITFEIRKQIQEEANKEIAKYKEEADKYRDKLFALIEEKAETQKKIK